MSSLFQMPNLRESLSCFVHSANGGFISLSAFYTYQFVAWDLDTLNMIKYVV